MAGSGIGVDVGARTVRLVSGREKGGQFQLLTVGMAERKRAADGTPADSIEDATASAVAETDPKKAPTVVGLSGRDLMLRYSQAPLLPVHRLKVLMDFEVQEISEKIDGEVSADYNLLPGEIGDGGEQMVLIAMAKDGYLEPRVDAVGASLPVRYATPNMIAAFNAFLKCGSFAEGETTVHLDIGQDNADLAIQRDGDLLFARNLAFGGNTFTEALASNFGLDWSKAEELKLSKGRIPQRGESFEDGLTEKTARALQGVLGQLVGLVQSSISFCKVQWKDSSIKIDRLVLSGGGALLPGLSKGLSENLAFPVELFDPSDRIDASLLDDEAVRLLEKRGAMFAVPIGLALMASDPRFFSVQVLPSALRRKKG